MPNYQVLIKLKSEKHKKKIHRKIYISSGSINDVEKEVKITLEKEEYVHDIINITAGNNHLYKTVSGGKRRNNAGIGSGKKI